MLATMAWLLTGVLVWTIAAPLLFWGRLPGAWRRTVSLLASGAGLAFLIVAINTEGVRESPTLAVFLIGTPYVTQQVSALASLPYYVLTAVCLLLGTAGLAVRDDVASRMGRHWMATAIGFSLLVTALRFCLEKVAAPRSLTMTVGVAWLAPVVGAFFLASLRAEGKGWRALAGSLLVYGLAVRGFVAALYLAASALHLGSHYDVSSVLRVETPFTHQMREFQAGSLEAPLYLGVLPQLLVWPFFTVVAGLLGAGLASSVRAVRGPAAPREPAAERPFATEAQRDSG